MPEKLKKIISQRRVHISFFYSLWSPQWPHFEPLYIEHILSSSNTISLNLLSFSLKVTLCRSVAVLSIKTFCVLRVIFECSPERNRSYVAINTYTLGMGFCRSIFFQVQCRMNKYYLSAAQYGWMAVLCACFALLMLCLFNLSLMTYIRAVYILWTPLYFKHLCIIRTSLHSIDTFPYCGHLSIMNAICILWTPLHTVDTSPL